MSFYVQKDVKSPDQCLFISAWGETFKLKPFFNTVWCLYITHSSTVADTTITLMIAFVYVRLYLFCGDNEDLKWSLHLDMVRSYNRLPKPLLTDPAAKGKQQDSYITVSWM